MEASRKSARVRKSRVIYIDGEPVLRLNNYSIEQGEPSILEGETDDDCLIINTISKPLLVKPIRKVAPPRKQPKETDWAVANEKIKRDYKIARDKRMIFLNSMFDVLEPFVTSEVKKYIKAHVNNMTVKEAVPKTNITKQPDCILNGEMRSYQLEGLSFMISMFDNGLSAILADEMGLGKTLQTISFLGYLKFERNIGGPHLIACPLSVLSSWLMEFKRWCPKLRVLRLHSSDKNERERLRKTFLKDASLFDVVVTTYDMLISRNMKWILQFTIHWRCLVLDEGHKIKNERAQISEAVRHIKRQSLLLLSGTPIQNNLHELWSLLNQLFPDIFVDPELFHKIFNFSSHFVDNQGLRNVHNLLKALSLRRLKSEVEQSLPQKKEIKVYCPLSKNQHFWYRRLLLKNHQLLATFESEMAGEIPKSKDAEAWKKLQSLLMQLRKCANHPYLFPGAEPDPHETGEDLVLASGKLQLLDRLLHKLQAGGHRVCLFSQFTSVLDILEDFAMMRGFNFRRLDGSTNRVQRAIDMTLFNKPGSSIFLYLLCTRAGGLGVNLQTADTVVLFDSDWNPQVDLQAMGRVHRIGQTKLVHIYRLVTAGTVEDYMQLRAEKKLFLNKAITDGAVCDSDSSDSSNISDWFSAVTFGAQAIMESDDICELSDKDLDNLIDRSGAGHSEVGRQVLSKLQRLETSPLDASKSSNNFKCFEVLSKLQRLEASPLDGSKSSNNYKCFEGIDYSRLALKDIGMEWRETSKRKRVTTTVNIDGYTVYRRNMYSLNDGEPSVYDHECSQKNKDAPEKRKLQIAGTDYEHEDQCLVCWDGGILVCCDGCPATYHAECIGLSEALPRLSWHCPHHACGICYRKAAAAGGLLFRCEMCSNAYCEDHLPVECELIGNCKRFEDLGYIHPKQAFYIHCSTECHTYAAQSLKPDGAKDEKPNHVNQELKFEESEDKKVNIKSEQIYPQNTLLSNGVKAKPYVPQPHQHSPEVKKFASLSKKVEVPSPKKEAHGWSS